MGARSVSVGNMLDLLDGHSETQTKRKRKSKSVQNTPNKNVKFRQKSRRRRHCVSSSVVLHIADEEFSDTPINTKKKKRKNARNRSMTAPKPKVINTEHMQLPFLEQRKRATHHSYAKSSHCPISPTIPELAESDDCLNIVHQRHNEDEMDIVSDQSSHGFSSDSESEESSNKIIIRQTHTDEYDFDCDEDDAIQSPKGRRANSNSSITSNSASSSSSNSSSDWDAEVREEEKAEAEAMSEYGALLEYDSESESVEDIKDALPMLLNRPTGESDEDNDDDDIKMDMT